MATRTVTTSGSNTTYVITDNEGSTCTLVFTSTPTNGVVLTSVTNSGVFHADGEQMLAQLLLLTATNLLPTS